MKLRRRLGIGARRQRQFVRAMEVGLVAMLVGGVLLRDTGMIVNAALALAVVQLPAVLQRDYGLVVDAGLTLWLTTAVTLHAVGTLAVGEWSLYEAVWWYDHLTHALSASIVAAAGYTTARVFDVHYDAVRLPAPFMFAFILVFTIAAGVLWEVLEFLLARASTALGGSAVLVQYGLGDTMLDLVFNTVGAVLVATFGTAHLASVVEAVSDRLGGRSTDP